MFVAKLSGFPFIGNVLDLCQFKMWLFANKKCTCSSKVAVSWYNYNYKAIIISCQFFLNSR